MSHMYTNDITGVVRRAIPVQINDRIWLDIDDPLDKLFVQTSEYDAEEAPAELVREYLVDRDYENFVNAVDDDANITEHNRWLDVVRAFGTVNAAELELDL